MGKRSKPVSGRVVRTGPLRELLFVIPPVIVPNRRTKKLEDKNKPESDNKWYGGIHWAVRSKITDHWHDVTHVCYLASDRVEVRPPFGVEFWWNTKLDIDNHSLTGKMIVDGLRKCGVLEDDSREYYKETVSRFWAGQGVRVRVYEMEDTEDAQGNTEA